MDEAQAFREILVEDLQGFGWSVSPDDIPDVDSCVAVITRMIEWWNGVGEPTRTIIGDADISLGLWNANMVTEWPLLYNLLQGMPFGNFKDTMFDVNRCVYHARDAAPDRAAQHLDTHVEDVVSGT